MASILLIFIFKTSTNPTHTTHRLHFERQTKTISCTPYPATKCLLSTSHRVCGRPAAPLRRIASRKVLRIATPPDGRSVGLETLGMNPISRRYHILLALGIYYRGRVHVLTDTNHSWIPSKNSGARLLLPYYIPFGTPATPATPELPS
jgi:hypothetical protein